jgi:glycosyltransferase involved in cell wall biosynthesis
MMLTSAISFPNAAMQVTPTLDIHEPFLSVVVPAYNEAASIESLLQQVLALSFVLEVVVVDDCSTDETAQVCQIVAATDKRVRLIRLSKNGGKTEALKIGFAQTTGAVVIVQDADLEYDPGEINLVVAPIIKGQADVVYGSRFMVRRATRVLYFYHSLANNFLTFLSNCLTNLNMTDVETCYKAFRGDIIRNMIITSRGFGFEIEVTAKVAKLKCAVYEVPISYYGRTYEEGKKIGTLDGLSAIWYIIRYNLFTGLRTSYRVLPSVTHGTPSSLSISKSR